jgi:uncharacterized protein YceH (UPF0502 family)
MIIALAYIRMTPKNPSDKALREFSEAFERLKRNEPRRLVAGARVTQNNVSREAGKDAAALKKSLYPDLVQSIQEWVGANVEPAPPSALAQARDEIDGLRARVAELEAEVARLRQDCERLAGAAALSAMRHR